MKTGFTDQSGYGLVATAKRDDRRIIVVLAGLDSAKQRKSEGERVLEYGFREFQEYRLFQPGQQVADADVWLGAAAESAARDPGHGAAITLSREARKGLVVKLDYASPIAAPVVAGTELGHADIDAPGMAPISLPLVAGSDVPKAEPDGPGHQYADLPDLGPLGILTHEGLPRGRFITFEGGEGAGKSTQCRRLAERLRDRGIAASSTREPGGTEGAEAIRELIVHGPPERWRPLSELCLFMAARDDHLHRAILPALDRGEWVLCDRFANSSRVYQGYAGGLGLELVDPSRRRCWRATCPT